VGIEQANEFWRGFFDISAGRWGTPGTFVVPHAALGDYSGVWFFVREGQCVISAPPGWCMHSEQMARRSQLAPELPTADRIASIFGSSATVTVGPAWHGFLSGSVRAVDGFCRGVASDSPGVAEFRAACTATDWDHGGLDSAEQPWSAAMDSSRISAIAALRKKQPQVFDVCVIARPDVRGGGFAQMAVSAAVAQRPAGAQVLYQTLSSNRAAVRLAQALGFERYAEHLAVRLRHVSPQQVNA